MSNTDKRGEELEWEFGPSGVRIHGVCVCVWMRVCDLTKAREDTLRQKEGWRDGG